jgi:cobalamin biosynthesis Mg chelatase CobN
MLIMTLLSLTGCLYPGDQSTSSTALARESVLTVQDAVDRYKEKTGLLPIQNAKETVPLYEKYKVDFGKLKRMDYIAQIPTASYENGGSYQFLIIDEETKPLVKLLDLSVFQAVSDVQKKVDEYRSNHSDQNPAGDEIYPGFAIVDFKKLGSKAPDIISVYSRQSLNLLVSVQGQVLVDYGIDIVTAIKKSGIQPPKDEDLRRKLIEASYFVPVRSPVYHLVNGEPQAIQTE